MPYPHAAVPASMPRTFTGRGSARDRTLLPRKSRLASSSQGPNELGCNPGGGGVKARHIAAAALAATICVLVGAAAIPSGASGPPPLPVLTAEVNDQAQITLL